MAFSLCKCITSLRLACHPTYMVLNHVQVDPEPMQFDLEQRSNLQCAHGGLGLGEPSLMLGKVSFVLALRELAFQSAERSVQSDDTTNGRPAVKARGKADDGDERRDDWDDEEQDTVKQ